MRRRGTLTLLALAALGAPAALSGQSPLPTVTPRSGLLLTSSARLLPGTYRLGAPASLDSAAITLRGDDLTLDLTGVTLEGSDPAGDPDRSQGVAIRIVGGRNVRIVGGRIRGYKIAVLVRGTRNLRLSGIDASDNWRPRLYSGVEHESLADWLSFHHNEQDEWLRYGAGFYLSGVHGGELRANRVRQGMNGLLLVRSDSLRIEENDFSFNSGLGIGLYRSSDNRILANRLDYNVRGYSHGFYRRGQDSAGLLLYEQSTGNLVAWNSATHGGDGLFLWAGQQTMDSGRGGANDNLFYRNDFSFAPANAMEATFSRNAFVANRAVGSDYGLWGGYSFDSRVIANCFVGNRTGIAIEHGQDNAILGNRFVGDSTAIALWGDPIEPSDWGYPKHRDTRSRDYRIEGNLFEGNRVALRARNTAGLKALANRYVRVDSLAVLRDTSGFLTDAPLASGGSAPAEESCEAPQSLPADLARLVASLGPPRRVPGSPVASLDRSAMVVDEWGPYDWSTPRLWPLDSTRAVPLRLRTLGPGGSWQVVGRRGIAQLSAEQGQLGDTLLVTPAAAALGDWELVLEYRGAAGVGRTRFSYGRFEPAIAWTARFFGWTEQTDLRQGPERFAAAAQGPALLTRELARLDFEWYRPLLAGLPTERWAMEATGSVVLPPGRYQLRCISDDGLRVWVDGVLALDHWAPHESAVDTLALAAGRHDLRVQYYQADGWTELRVEVVRLTRTP